MKLRHPKREGATGPAQRGALLRQFQLEGAEPVPSVVRSLPLPWGFIEKES
jgi:hypothetical protein